MASGIRRGGRPLAFPFPTPQVMHPLAQVGSARPSLSWGNELRDHLPLKRVRLLSGTDGRPSLARFLGPARSPKFTACDL